MYLKNAKKWVNGNFVSLNMTHLQMIQLLLTGAKGREWMGCWGLLGLLLIVIVDHSLIPCVQHQ